MKFLERWAWDLIPAVFMAAIGLWSWNLYVQDTVNRSCPTMYKMKVQATKSGAVLVCVYKP